MLLYYLYVNFMYIIVIVKQNINLKYVLILVGGRGLYEFEMYIVEYKF